MQDENGHDVIVKNAGKELTLRKPYKKIENNENGQTTIEIAARNEEEFKGLLKSLEKQGTINQKQSKDFAEQATIRDYKPELKKSVSISQEAFPSIVKSAVNYYLDQTHDNVTKRFDVLENGKRINQSDFAQIAGLVPEKNGSNYKYEGISYEEIAELIQKYVSAADVAVEVFFRTVLFNYLVCNGDAHAKNFSLRSTPEAPGVYELTPAYDLLNTSLHIPNEMSRMALDLFKDEDDFSTPFYEMNCFYGGPDFMEFAKRIGVVEKRAKRFIKQAVDSVPIMEAMLDDSFLSDSGKEKYKASVRDRAMALGGL